MPSPAPSVLVDHPAAHVTRITLNRPERRNALTWPMVDALRAAVAALERDDSRTVILTGAGDAFCVGLDLHHREDPFGCDDAVVDVHRRQAGLARVVSELHRAPQPVIAALDGPTAGGGLALALAADIRLCTAGAALNAGFVRVGLSAGDAGISALLPRIVGFGRATEIVLNGRSVDAEEALRIGLVTTVVADADALASAALETATRIAGHAPYAVAMTKQLLYQAADGLPLEAVLQLENRTQALATRTADAREGAAAFLARRPPEFEGR